MIVNCVIQLEDKVDKKATHGMTNLALFGFVENLRNVKKQSAVDQAFQQNKMFLICVGEILTQSGIVDLYFWGFN